MRVREISPLHFLQSCCTNRGLMVNAEEKLVKQDLPIILIVDDHDLSLKSLEYALQSEKFEILTAINGQDAINLLKEYPVTLIICDLNLPDISGIDVLKEAIVLRPKAIRIVMSAINDLQTVAEAINVGQIFQFLLKPWELANLNQVVHIALEKYKLLEENEKLYDLISDQHKALSSAHQTLRQELQLGARIHEILLLGKVPVNIPGIQTEALTIPSKDIDGDFFDFYRPFPHIFDVIFGDVMGKGIPAALVGTAIKTQLVRFALPYTHGQIYDEDLFWQDDMLTPGSILTHVHSEIASQLINLEFFVSLFYGRFNISKQTLTYIDCGSTKPIHYQASSNKTFLLTGENFPIGMVEKANYSSIEVPYYLGDLFIFYSDGATEARTVDGEFYGIDRLRKFVESHIDLDPSQLIKLIKKDVQEFSQKEDFDDDFTVIIIKICDILPLSTLPPVKSVTFASDLSQLKAVRQFVKRVCLEAPRNAAHLSDELQLAINEAFCNIVNHSYEKQKGVITIKGEYFDNGVAFELSDQGRIFEPSLVDVPDFSGNKESGFGLYLVSQLVDKVQYIPKTTDLDWNRLRIIKNYHTNRGKMKFSHRVQDNVLIIILEGESLDAKDAPIFKQQMKDLLLVQPFRHLIFDLHQLQFIDSSGLGSFLSVLRVLNTEKGDLKLASMTKPIRTMFELVSMHKIFEIYNSTEDALQSYKI